MARPKGSTNKPKQQVVQVVEAPAPTPKAKTGMNSAFLEMVNSECDDIQGRFPFMVAVRNELGINPHIVLPFKHGHFVRPERFGRGERIFCFKSKSNMVKFKEIVRMK